jgi:hypothetical protein
MRPNTLTNTKTKDKSWKKLHKTNTPPHNKGSASASMLATTIHKSNTTPHHQDGATPPTQQAIKPAPGVVSGPNSVPAALPPKKPEKLLLRTQPTPTTDDQAPHGPHPHQLGVFFVVLLRKEVIQPHLPVRLPCYDFVPIADPTFDSSPHKG